MIDIKSYFQSLFSDDCTMGLDPFDEDFNMRISTDDNGDVILIVRDSSEDDWDDVDFDPDSCPLYEIRISRIN